MHLQPAPPALGEYFLPFDRKDGSSSDSRKQASGWRSEVPACWPGGHPPFPSPSPLPGPADSPAWEWGSPLLLSQPRVALSALSHTLSHLFLVQHKLSHAQMHTDVYTSIHICTLMYAIICVTGSHMCSQTHCTHSSLHILTRINIHCAVYTYTFISLYILMHLDLSTLVHRCAHHLHVLTYTPTYACTHLSLTS